MLSKQPSTLSIQNEAENEDPQSQKDYQQSKVEINPDEFNIISLTKKFKISILKMSKA